MDFHNRGKHKKHGKGASILVINRDNIIASSLYDWKGFQQ